jgi:dTDP-4-dehydrorhamnose 3,5-epimerase
MIVQETGIEGLLLLEPKVFKDSRGLFFESFNLKRLEAKGIHYNFIQDNQSHSGYGVIRGLHFQKAPHEQAKLVRVIAGTVFDVAVDLRPSSSTYGLWFGTELSAENFLQLMIPGGFAHGFSVLSDHAIVQYKCDEYYHPEAESGIRFDDPDLGIDWRIEANKVQVSEKDRVLPYLKQL